MVELSQYITAQEQIYSCLKRQMFSDAIGKSPVLRSSESPKKLKSKGTGKGMPVKYSHVSLLPVVMFGNYVYVL